MSRLADALVAVVDTSHRALGRACDSGATLLEDTADTLRWVAALCRATP